MYRFLSKLHPACRPSKQDLDFSHKDESLKDESLNARIRELMWVKIHALIYALIQVGALLVIPVLFVLGDAAESPFLFTGVLQFGCGIGAYAVTMLFNSRTKTRKKLFISTVIENIWSPYTLILMSVSVIANCMLVLFAWGLLFVNASTVAILYETRQLFLSFTKACTFKSIHDQPREHRRDESCGAFENRQNLRLEDHLRQRLRFFRTLIFCVPAIAGVVLVILSHHDIPQPLLEIGAVFASPGTLLGGTLLGASLVLIAAFFWSLQRICAGEMAKRLGNKYPNPKNAEAYEMKMDIKDFDRCMTSISLVIAGVVLCAIGLAIELIASKTISFSLHQLFYAFMGALAYSIGAVAKEVPRIYLIIAKALNERNRENAQIEYLDMGVKAVHAVRAFRFATPLGILILLWMLSILDVVHLDYLIIGAMGITVSNLLIRDDTSERLSYQALMVSLWLFGTITYFTDGLVTDVPLELPVTVFILVLVFRVSRLVRRTSDEEGWMLEAFHKLKLCASKEKNAKLKDYLDNARELELISIDKHKSAGELIKSYKKLVEYLERLSVSYSNKILERRKRLADPKIKYDDMTREAAQVNLAADNDALNEISDIRRLVDMLVHSRQQGSRFDEIVAVALTGAGLVLGLLVFNGDGEFYSEFSSFLLSSVVVFLFFNILDLEKDRKDKTMTKYDEMNDDFKNRVSPAISIVNVEGAKKRDLEGASVVKSIVIVAGFLLLFTGVFK